MSKEELWDYFCCNAEYIYFLNDDLPFKLSYSEFFVDENDMANNTLFYVDKELGKLVLVN